MTEARLLAWEGVGEDGYRAVVYLIAGEPAGELELYRDDVLLTTRRIGIPEIAMFAAHRNDLINRLMDEIIASVRVH